MKAHLFLGTRVQEEGGISDGFVKYVGHEHIQCRRIECGYSVRESINSKPMTKIIYGAVILFHKTRCLQSVLRIVGVVEKQWPQ